MGAARRLGDLIKSKDDEKKPIGGPGLERMRDRTPDGLCPFCLDDLATSVSGKPTATCGSRECVRAYQRTYQRDRRAGNRVKNQRTVKK
jgi:hypothetical protein